MKTNNQYLKLVFISTVLFLLIFSASIASFGQELTGEEIIDKVNELMNQDTVQAKIKIAI